MENLIVNKFTTVHHYFWCETCKQTQAGSLVAELKSYIYAKMTHIFHCPVCKKNTFKHYPLEW